MFSRASIIEGLIRARFQSLTDSQFEKLFKCMNKLSNDDLASDYFKTTKTHIRQITSNTFIALT